MSLSIFPRFRVLVSLSVSDKTSLKKMLSNDSPLLESVLEVEEPDPEDEFVEKPRTTIRTKFSVLQCVRIPFLMRCGFWPLIHSQEYPFSSQSFPSGNTAGVFPRTFIVKNLQFFDVHCCLFMRLHFSIGDYDYRRTARYRESIHFSITQVFFADHMHWRTGVDNKFSVLRFKTWCRQAPIFRRWKECSSFLLFEFEQFFGHLPRCFAGTLLLPFCLLLRSIFKFGNFGDTLMRSTWANICERLILLSNLSVTCNSFSEFQTLDWFLLHVWALPQDRLRQLHVVRSMIGVQVLVSTHDKYHVWHRVSQVFRDFLSRLTTSCHTLSCKSFSFSMPTALSSSFFLDLLHGCSSTWRCAYEHFSKTATTLGLVEQAFWRMPPFTEWNWFKFLWSNLCRTIETFYHWDFLLGLRLLDAFLSFCCMKELGDGFGCVIFEHWLT